MSLYLAVGVLGYFYATGKTCGNILNNFEPHDMLINVGRTGLALTLFFSFPLLVLPCRDSLAVIVSDCCGSGGGQAGVGAEAGVPFP